MKSILRDDFIVKTLNKKLILAFNSDPTRSQDCLDHSSDNSIINNAHYVLDILKKYDPSKKYKYLQWIANKYTQNNFYLEDLTRIYQDLCDFERYKNKLSFRDINRYKTTSDLFLELKKVRDADVPLSKRQEEKTKEQNFFETKQAELFYQGEQIKVLIPRTAEASCWFGKGTAWCTASTSSKNFFLTYSQQGDLYIVYTPAGRYQFHFETSQFRDESDRMVSLMKLVHSFPEIKKAFNSIGEKYGIIYLMENPSQQAYINALRKPRESSETKIELIRLMPPEFQNEEIIDIAFSISFKAAKTLIRSDLQQTRYFQQEAVKYRPELIQVMDPEFQTKELIESIIFKQPSLVAYVREDLLEEQILIKIVKRHPQILKLIPKQKQTIKVIEEAVNSVESKAVKRSIINMVHDHRLKTKLKQALMRTTV